MAGGALWRGKLPLESSQRSQRVEAAMPEDSF
jgi:hypothetical protein